MNGRRVAVACGIVRSMSQRARSTRRKTPRAFAEAPSSYADASHLVCLEGAVSLRVDTATERERLRLRAPRPSLILTLPGSVAVRSGSKAFRIDRSSWLVLVADAGATIEVESPTARVAVLEPGRKARARMVSEYAREKVDAASLTRVLSRTRILPRTTWVDELAHRYVFERGICEKHDSTAAVFLETELLKEVYFLVTESEQDRDRAPLSVGKSTVVARALEVIEASLGVPLTVDDLARRAGASPRTLERAFRRELGLAPAEHLRKRRLDEARVLLRAGRLNVGEVATHVGYRSVPAFSTAYRSQFGHPPSFDRG